MKNKVSYTAIQSNLKTFKNRWHGYSKNEKTGAQTFLNEFFESFGIIFDPNKLPYELNTGQGFADCYIKGKIILEMKDGNKVKNKADLLKALPQAEKYWRAKGKETNFIVLCNFKSFIILDTRDKSKSYVKLNQVDVKAELFSFLANSSPLLIEEQEAVSKNATKIMGRLYKSLRHRLKSSREDEIDTFILQCVFCMFAEDIGFLPYGIFTKLVEKVSDGEYNSADLLTQLFRMMDEQDTGRKQESLFENVRWFNGPLFKVKPEIVLSKAELELLAEACDFDWSHIRPEIFGVLFESSTDSVDRHESGMHYTFEEDILKIVKPCILDYWEEKFSKCKTQKDYEKLHRELLKYRVLDPACGSGNFLLVAYREIKRIESRIFHRISSLTGKSYSWSQKILGHYPVQNIYGIEINKFPTLIARVSLWITKKMVQEELSLEESDLPLEELSHIIQADALVHKWDDIDVVVGNPPFIGCKKIREFRGEEYFSWLSSAYPNHNKMSDYCTYWYNKAIHSTRKGTRIGLVSTNTVTQTNSRKASLDKIIEEGGDIFNAYSSFQWSGEAKVHVSIVNFVNKDKFKGQQKLNEKAVSFINSRLSCEDNSNEKVYRLESNQNEAFVGPTPNGKGFLLNEAEYYEVIKKDINSKKVIHKYITGKDLNQSVDQSASRYIIDFEDFELQDAKKYKEAFKIVKNKVKPVRDQVKRKKYREIWWRFQEEQMLLRKSIKGLDKFIITSRVSKHPIFSLIENKDIIPADSTVVIASDDYRVSNLNGVRSAS